MNMLLFFLTALIILTDVFILGNEIGSANFKWYVLKFLTVITGVLTFGFVLKIKNEVKVFLNWRLSNWILFSVYILICMFSIVLSLNKQALDWDAVALYAARGKFLKSGVQFSKMLELSKYDDLNAYYYLLYPPFTSILHYYWDSSGTTISPAIIYSIFFILLGLSIFYLTYDDLGVNKAIFLAILTISNNNIFGLSFFEYTNIPFSVYLITGLFLLKRYLDKGGFIYLYSGAFIFSSAQAIRFAEPIFPALLFSCLIAWVLTKNINFCKIFVITGILGSIRYLEWNILTKQIAHITNYTNISLLSLMEAIIGGFIGSWIDYSKIFVKSFYSILIPVITSFSSFSNIKKSKSYGDILLILFSFLSIVIYFGTFYLLSFSTSWWQTALSESLIRSTIYLIPISAYLLIKNVLS